MRAPQSQPAQEPVFRSGFAWTAADAYLFDIDGTLLNSLDSVHYFAFLHAVRNVLGIAIRLEGIPVHGNTDTGIVREALRRAGVPDRVVQARLPTILETMCAEVGRNYDELDPEICPAIPELLNRLRQNGKLMGTASGNLEAIGWWKLQKAGLKEMFDFGSFSWPREARAEIFQHGVRQARHRLGPAASVYVVGDTPADIDAARTIGVPVIALATGIFSWDQLRACAPDACLACAADLLSFSQP